MSSLFYERKNGFDNITEEEKAKVFSFCEDYRKFITDYKTEREFAKGSVEVLEKAGFKELSKFDSLKAGDKVYYVNRGKGIFAAVIGEKPITEGVNLVGAHIDSPRIDLKPNPLYEDSGIALFKTHYYGGIKKYQWTTIPLSLHGVVVKPGGETVEINVGDSPSDPVFTISDILPHLAQDQMKKTLGEAFTGENLNVILGNIASQDEDVTEKVKANILKILNDKYGIEEIDFVTSELEFVPAFEARDLGFDRSMIAGYGQDDRVCGYPALMAVVNCEKPERTAIALLVDKEEIGSMGNTGMQSKHFENVLGKLISLSVGNYNDLMLRECLTNSICLSADVGVALDPSYPEVSEKKNSAILNGGLLLNKYTGARGKSGASDANAEFVAEVVDIFNKNDVKWQIAELGRVDLGGGGTIAQFVANLDMEVIDCGVPILSMHSPYEVTGKFDIYMAYKGYLGFMNAGR